MVCVYEDALQSPEYARFREVSRKLSKPDIATIVDIMDSFLQNNNSSDIKSVLTDEEGHFLFLVNDGRSKSSFDFFKFLNRWYSEPDFRIDCVNVRQMFPRSMSMGEYYYSQGNDYDSTTDMDDNEATGFIDEDDLRGLQRQKTFLLEYVKTGAEISIDVTPVSIGRSVREAKFVIQGNNNVSRKHCEVYTKNGIPYIKDNDSLNGTFVNNDRLLTEERELHKGDIVYVADEKFVVRV